MASVVVVPQLTQMRSEKLKLCNICHFAGFIAPTEGLGEQKEEPRVSSPRSPCRQVLWGHTRSLGTHGNAKAPLPSEKPAYWRSSWSLCSFPSSYFQGLEEAVDDYWGLKTKVHSLWVTGTWEQQDLSEHWHTTHRHPLNGKTARSLGSRGALRSWRARFTPRAVWSLEGKKATPKVS